LLWIDSVFWFCDLIFFIIIYSDNQLFIKKIEGKRKKCFVGLGKSSIFATSIEEKESCLKG